MELTWSEPLRLCESSFEDLDRRVPKSPGVYLWLVGPGESRRVSYVGQSQNLWWRQREHIRGTPGGEYYLYNPPSLAQGEPPEPWYNLNGFENSWEGDRCFEGFAGVALANLRAYEVVWAELGPAETGNLKAVESATTQRLMEQGGDAVRAFVNSRVNVGTGSLDCRRVTLGPRAGGLATRRTESFTHDVQTI